MSVCDQERRPLLLGVAVAVCEDVERAVPTALAGSGVERPQRVVAAPGLGDDEDGARLRVVRRRAGDPGRVDVAAREPAQWLRLPQSGLPADVARARVEAEDLVPLGGDDQRRPDDQRLAVHRGAQPLRPGALQRPADGCGRVPRPVRGAVVGPPRRERGRDAAGGPLDEVCLLGRGRRRRAGGGQQDREGKDDREGASHPTSVYATSPHVIFAPGAVWFAEELSPGHLAVTIWSRPVGSGWSGRAPTGPIPIAEVDRCLLCRPTPGRTATPRP